MTTLSSSINTCAGSHVSSLPGFGASHSLNESQALYHGGASLSGVADDMVQPEFLGVIKEAFESVGHALSGALISAAQSLASTISNIGTSGGPGDQPFVCGQWIAGLLACSNGQPTYAEGQMMAACANTNLAYSAACITVTSRLYPLLQQTCAQDPSQVSTLLGQICPNG